MKPLNLFVIMLIAFQASYSQATIPENNAKKLPRSLFAGLGAAFNSFSVTGNASYHETKIDHTVPVSPAFVIGARLYTDNKTSKFYLSPMITVYSFKANGKVDLTSGLARYQHASSFESKVVVAPSFSLGYDVMKQAQFKWHISAGLGFNFLINSRELQTTTYTNAPPRVVDNTPESMVFVFNLGTGVDVGKNITVWLNYLPPANITKYVNKSAKLSSLQVGMGWCFTKGK